MIDNSDSGQHFDKSRKSWTEDEDNVLMKLVKKYGIKRWNDISKAMADMFDITTKSGKQCRERWVNHLDPKINKEKWTTEEERKIFEAHKVYGNKWKMIAKQLNSRTDNSIKNHFYSILRKGLRRINKMMGDRKSTEIVKEIRTSVLSKLDNLDKSSAEKVSKVNVSKIYELLFQFSSMNSGNISEKNLTLDMKNDFKEMISHLMELSSMEKIKKEKNIAMNKDKRNIKNSAHKISESSAEIELQNESFSLDHQIEEEKKEGHFFEANLSTAQNHNGFFVNLEIPYKVKDHVISEKFQIEERTSQKASSFINFNQSPRKNVIERGIEQKFEIPEFIDSEKGEDFNNIFPSITINLEEPMSFNDFSMNCFNKSPLFSSHRMADHFNIRTPRVPSPGAFNFCNVSTAQSMMVNYAPLTKEGNEQKGMGFDNELDKIVEQLRSNINSNCSTGPAVGLRVSSSRNSCADPCLKASSSAIFLTPRSGSGKAH